MVKIIADEYLMHIECMKLLTWKTAVIVCRLLRIRTSFSKAELASLSAPPRLVSLLDSLTKDCKSSSDLKRAKTQTHTEVIIYICESKFSTLNLILRKWGKQNLPCH